MIGLSRHYPSRRVCRPIATRRCASPLRLSRRTSSQRAEWTGLVVLAPADGRPVGSQGAAMAPSTRERGERLPRGNVGHLVLVVQSPAGDSAVRPDSAGVQIACADCREGGVRRWRHLAMVVVNAAPTDDGAGGSESAGMGLSGADRRECFALWGRRLVLLIVAPTDRGTVALQSTAMDVSGANADECLTGGRGRLSAVALSPADGRTVGFEPARV